MKKGKIICFLGIDGSGKSTLARSLYRELEKRGNNVTYTWWQEGDYSLFRQIALSIGSSKRLHVNRDSHTRETPAEKRRLVNKLFKLLWPTAVILDYLRFAFVKAWIPAASRDKIIVFDRFMYDVVGSLSEEFEWTEVQEHRLQKLCAALIPKPDLVFMIQVPPEVAYMRKKEELQSIDMAEGKLKVLQRLDPVLGTLTPGKIVTVDNTQDLECVETEILMTTLDFLRGG